MKRYKERRQYPRIVQRLPLKILANGYDFSTVTQNISCLGAYCHVDKYIPPFTKIMVKLTLPFSNKEGDSNSHVECKGVVVRTEDEKSGGFNIAIFFNEIKENQRHKIAQYLNRFLPQDTLRYN
ncbi:MAG: PilZ domain-containing protein [Candidatus Omnitrophica bacterium]|nr:PilZ domain-containing protein [Candidatus Omnitrophota bacterium]